jgi:hypothetical protein
MLPNEAWTFSMITMHVRFFLKSSWTGIYRMPTVWADKISFSIMQHDVVHAASSLWVGGGGIEEESR